MLTVASSTRAAVSSGFRRDELQEAPVECLIADAIAEIVELARVRAAD